MEGILSFQFGKQYLQTHKALKSNITQLGLGCIMNRILGLLICLCSLGSVLTAQDKGFGLGIIIGEPTGLSGKYWVSSQNAIDAGMAWSFRHSGFLHLHADYLWHFPDAIQATQRFPLYAGIGGRIGFAKQDAVFGIRVVGGIAWWPKDAPIDVFLELAPIIDLAPASEFSVNGGFGVRYYFK